MLLESPADIQRLEVVALGINPIIKEDIDKVYQQIKNSIYSDFKDSIFYNDNIILSFKSSDVRDIQKAAIVYFYYSETGNKDKITQLMKKAYKKANNLVKNSGKDVDCFLVAKTFLVSDHSAFKKDMMQEKDIFGNLIAVTHFSQFYQKELTNLFHISNFLGSYISKLLARANNDAFDEYKIDTSIYKERVKKSIKELFPNTSKDSFLEDISERISALEHEELLKNDLLNRMSNNSIVVSPNELVPRETTFAEGKLSRYIGGVHGAFNNAGIYEEVINHKISIEEIEAACTSFELAKKFNNISEEHRILYIYFTLHIFAFAKEYTALRNMYLEENVEAHLLELNEQKVKLEKEFEMKTSEINSSLAKFEKEIKKKDEELDRHKDKIKELEAELKSAQVELDKREDYSNEVKGLREYVISLDAEEEDSDLTIEEQLETLNKHEFVFVGGRFDWTNNLEKHFKNANFISVDAKTSDLRYLKNKDCIVVINTAVLSHSLFHKLMSILNKSNSRIIFINKNHGLNRTIQVLHESLLQQS